MPYCQYGTINNKLMQNDLAGWKVLTFTALGSTNNYCRDLLQEKDVREGTVVRAIDQTEGKGQGTNTWESEPGKNLTFSIILRPRFLNPPDQFLLSMVASLAISGFLQEYTGGISIKWPNDIYADDKKIAGILIENSVIENSIDSTIMGIGVNINQVKFSNRLGTAISLAQLTGMTFSLVESLEKLCSMVSSLYNQLRRGEQDIIKKRYTGLMYRLNTESTYRSSGQEFRAIARGVDNSGRLILDLPGKGTRCFSFQEVEFSVPGNKT